MLEQKIAYDPTQRFTVKVQEVEYLRHGDEVFLARVYQPNAPGPFPGIVDVHGGQWTKGDRAGTVWEAEMLASTGLVVFTPDFRTATPTRPYPQALEDISYAIRWFKAHAGELGALGEGVGGLGSSSGGHLVMLSAMRSRDGRYATIPLAAAPALDATLDYLLLVWPILDPYGRFIFAQASGREDIIESTRTFFRPWEAIWDGNPMAILERGEPIEHPPAIIIQGAADANVTPALQERFVTAYRASGGEIDLEVFPDQPHQLTRQPGPATDRAHALLRAFVARQLERLSAHR